MGKAYRFVISILFLNLGINSFSQGRFSINLGASVPVSHYRSSNINDEYSGQAGIGPGVGLQYVFPLGEQGFGIYVGVDAIYNGVRKSVRDDFENSLKNLGLSKQDISIEWAKSFNFPLSIGVNINHGFTDNLALFTNGGLVYNILKITDQVNISPASRSTIKTGLAEGFGVRIGGGITIKKKISVSVSYLRLGKYNLHRRAEYSGTFENFDSKEQVDMCSISLGYIFHSK